MEESEGSGRRGLDWDKLLAADDDDAPTPVLVVEGSSSSSSSSFPSPAAAAARDSVDWIAALNDRGLLRCMEESERPGRCGLDWDKLLTDDDDDDDPTSVLVVEGSSSFPSPAAAAAAARDSDDWIAALNDRGLLRCMEESERPGRCGLDWDKLLADDDDDDAPTSVLVVERSSSSSSSSFPSPAEAAAAAAARDSDDWIAALNDLGLAEHIARQARTLRDFERKLANKGEKLRSTLRRLEEEQERRKLRRIEKDADESEKPT